MEKKEKITKEEIKILAAKYGKLSHIKDNDKEIFIKKIDRNVLKFILPRLMSNQYVEVVETIIKNCQVAGDDVLGDDDFILGMIPFVDSLIKVKQLEIKEV